MAQPNVSPQTSSDKSILAASPFSFFRSSHWRSMCVYCFLFPRYVSIPFFLPWFSYPNNNTSISQHTIYEIVYIVCSVTRLFLLPLQENYVFVLVLSLSVRIFLVFNITHSFCVSMHHSIFPSIRLYRNSSQLLWTQFHSEHFNELAEDGPSIVQFIGKYFLTESGLIQIQISPRGICGGQNVVL
jgi:hypothetical protein